MRYFFSTVCCLNCLPFLFIGKIVDELTSKRVSSCGLRDSRSLVYLSVRLLGAKLRGRSCTRFISLFTSLSDVYKSNSFVICERVNLRTGIQGRQQFISLRAIPVIIYMSPVGGRLSVFSGRLGVDAGRFCRNNEIAYICTRLK
jgi:hypothetical protein